MYLNNFYFQYMFHFWLYWNKYVWNRFLNIFWLAQISLQVPPPLTSNLPRPDLPVMTLFTDDNELPTPVLRFGRLFKGGDTDLDVCTTRVVHPGDLRARATRRPQRFNRVGRRWPETNQNRGTYGNSPFDAWTSKYAAGPKRLFNSHIGACCVLRFFPFKHYRRLIDLTGCAKKLYCFFFIR